ncbi:hypothetical protein AUK40_02595 [Candidatus Wirthbacteria bacterium CG2_30_54_11]|uniref:DNA methylase N-4/N-6 domain-containing protein n=1 Tax=Candidatus Wirthbacteria bacterium CG2_30_54_11 TaxID=1817892 RepID=A0A1J5IKP9_9BACT|nr:MAG: hypothetical protein AUK40_02595 [Candidatus Wirthbacteria bacterium CG2_30_54_11]
MATINFKGKSIIWNHHLSVPYHTLEVLPELGHNSDHANGNLIVEGDNLIALKSLLPRYAGQVKCIYIDPPYNTGNEGWAYNDKVNSPLMREWLDKEVGADDLSKHEKWLCMMTPRLKLLRELLTKDGVIFISIDDNEQHNLRILLNEIMGESNWVGTIIWKNATDNNPTNIAIEHENIHCYARDKTNLPNEWKSKISDVKEILVNIGNRLVEKYDDDSQLQLAYAAWFRANKQFLAPLDRYKYIDRGGVYTGNQSVHNPGKEGYRYDVVHPVTKKPCKQPLMGYRFPEETMTELIKQKKILFGDDDTKIVELKLYANEYSDKLQSVIEMDGRLGAYELRDIFPETTKTFDNPKPSYLIKQLVSFVVSKDDYVLDSFAGSGTTAHAVLDLNKEDGGNRKFILVQMPEDSPQDKDKNICRDVTRERVKRVIERNEKQPAQTKMDEKKPEKVGFEYKRVGVAIDPESMLSGSLPTYEQLAEYVYYLATGKNIESKKKIDFASSFVGQDKSVAIFLIYAQDWEKLGKMALTLDIAEQMEQKYKDVEKIVYAPACYLDEDYLDKFRIKFVSVPYNLFERVK